MNAAPATAEKSLLAFFEALEEQDISVGLRERLKAFQLLDALRGTGGLGRNAGAMFTSLLARSPEEQERIGEIFARTWSGLQGAPSDGGARAGDDLPERPRQPIPWRVQIAAFLFMLLGIGMAIAWHQPAPPVGGAPIEDRKDVDSYVVRPPPPTLPPPEDGLWTAERLLQALASSVESPFVTLREISAKGRWPPAEATQGRQLTLVDLVARTGLRPDGMLDLSDATTQARLLDGLPDIAGDFVVFPEPPTFGGPLDLADVRDALRAAIDPDPISEARGVPIVLERRPERIEFVRSRVGNVAMDEDFLDRALAIVTSSDDQTHQPWPENAFADASWRPALPSAMHRVPVWLPWLLAALPLLVYGAWLLRFRPPPLAEVPVDEALRNLAGGRPLEHRDIVGVQRLVFDRRRDRPRFKAIGNALGVRQRLAPLPIDPERTVDATARAGGFFTPVEGAVTASPAYLVLIEAHSTLDQETRRLEMLHQRLRETGIDTLRYYYIQDPAMLIPEWGQRPVPLADVAVLHDDRRLIVFGDAAGFIDAATLEPHPFAGLLEAWADRVLLTPRPIDAWGATEAALARRLAMPVGRATVEGCAALAELMGLSGSPDRPGHRAWSLPGGFDLRPPPPDLAGDSLRWLSSVEPDEPGWSRVLLMRLRRCLDPAGMAWLQALAVYPVLQWDLTLYLGLNLKDRDGRPLYTEPRLAALTQLPWLRAGRMPAWLRRVFVAGLDEAVRQETVSLIAALLQEQKMDKDTPAASAGRFVPYLGHRPAEDALFVRNYAVAMAQGDMRFWPLSFRERMRHLLRHWPVEETVNLLVAVLMAAALWWLAPAGGEPARTGAYLPVFALLLAAALGWGFAKLPAARLWQAGVSGIGGIGAAAASRARQGREAASGVWARLRRPKPAPQSVAFEPEDDGWQARQERAELK